MYVWKILEGLVVNFSHLNTVTTSDRESGSCLITYVNVRRKDTLGVPCV